MLDVRVVGIAFATRLALWILTSVSAPVAADEWILEAKLNDEFALEIEYPVAGSIVSDFGCGCFVAGRVSQARAGFDIAIVLDTSGSTANPSGADINRDGMVGKRRGVGQNWMIGTRSSDSGDSVLAAEVAAAERLIADLDPRVTRITVISFSGSAEPGAAIQLFGGRERPTTITHVPLTHDFHAVRDALRKIRLAGSSGGTDMAAGVRRGFAELNGLEGARSKRNDRNAKLMFFFTDGVPTAPYGPREWGKNASAVMDEARRAKRLGVVVHAFAIGETALGRPFATVQLADMTGGQFVPVVNPGELSAVLETIEFASLDQISIRSRPLGVDAELVHWAADGSWGGFVKLATGLNRIEVSAKLRDGSMVTEFVDVKANHSEKPASIPNALKDRFARLRKDCLRQVRGDAIMTERAADKLDLKKLKLEIEYERARARRRAAEQRKSLRLEVEEPDESPQQ